MFLVNFKSLYYMCTEYGGVFVWGDFLCKLRVRVSGTFSNGKST